MGFRLPRDPEAFSLDRPRRRDKSDKNPKHLAFVRKLLCCVCGSPRRVEAAHLRYADPRHDKPHTAMGQKPPDRYTVPLCEECHRTGPDAQHTTNERDWWQAHGIDAIALANRLYEISGDLTAGQAIVAARGHHRFVNKA